jgi:predicted GNAT family acetyltransferase
MAQRAFMLTKVRHPLYASGSLRVATESDIDLIARWLFDFDQEALGGGGDRAGAGEAASKRVQERSLYLWEDGQPTCLAGKARPTMNGITINAVYTPPELRGRGYATSCVAALSQLLLDSGRKFCTLFTDLANPTSNSIYQKIGYAPVGDYAVYLFGP